MKNNLDGQEKKDSVSLRCFFQPLRNPDNAYRLLIVSFIITATVGTFALHQKHQDEFYAPEKAKIGSYNSALLASSQLNAKADTTTNLAKALPQISSIQRSQNP